MLPEGTSFDSYEEIQREEIINEQAEKESERKSAAELARIKLNAKARLANASKPTTSSRPRPSEAKVQEAKEAIRVVEELEAHRAEPLRVDKVASTVMASGTPVSPTLLNDALKLQGTSKKDVAALLASLNINTSIQLTKQDTQNLLACLLTCNETQLQALMANKKVPIVIKTVIKRLLIDVEMGSIDTIEKLWDRIFGKTGLVQALPETTTATQTGLIPNVPVSREAYIVIRDTLLQG